MRKAIFVLVALFSSINFAFAEGNIVISDAWVREVPPGATVSAAYMTIENKSDQADKLTAISSDAAKAVELHKSTVDENGVASMEMVEVVELPPGESVQLKPGGMHLMLIGLSESLVGKDKITINFSFENSEDLTIEVPVKSTKGSSEMHHH